MPIPQLSTAERAEKRSAAHALNPVVMIGAEGLTEAVIAEIDRSLEAHELIKVRVLGDDRDSRKAMYEAICERLSAAPIQHIGKLLVLWRDGPAVLETGSDADARIDRAREKGKAPRTVVVRKPVAAGQRRPRPSQVRVLGNERLTAGGNVKRAKPRKVSTKKRALD